MNNPNIEFLKNMTPQEAEDLAAVQNVKGSEEYGMTGNEIDIRDLDSIVRSMGDGTAGNEETLHS